MKKRVSVILAIALLFLTALPTMAEEMQLLTVNDIPREGKIRVSGHAVVYLSADTATLQIGVNTKKSTVQEAQSVNAALMNQVIEAIRGAGVAEKDVTTSQFDVYSLVEYVIDENGKENSIPCYQVSNMLSVTVRDLSKLGAVLDAAMAAGANTTYGIQFSSTKENEAYQKALTRAVEDGAQKAAVLAAAAGKELGDLIEMDATQQNHYYGITNTYDAKSAVERTMIVSGDVSVSASVVMTYVFR